MYTCLDKRIRGVINLLPHFILFRGGICDPLIRGRPLFHRTKALSSSKLFFSDGRRLSEPFCFFSLESWDGWKWASSAGILCIMTRLHSHLGAAHVCFFCCRSAALSWLPASLLFVGNIYAGSRALSHLVCTNRSVQVFDWQLLRLFVFLFVQDIPFFFTLQNSSHVVTYVISTFLHREVGIFTVICLSKENVASKPVLSFI